MPDSGSGRPCPTSERIRFRLPDIRDAEFYLDLMNDPDFHRNIGDRGLRDIPAMETHIREKLLPTFSKNGFGMWLLELKSSNRPIGVCGLVDRDGFEGIDLGYALLNSCRGRGLAREAASAVLEYNIETLGIHSLFAIVSPDNVPSKSLLEAIGFTWRDQMNFPATDDPIDVYDWSAPKAPND
jgi:ribosomal-protein-alanine N-acetyltransferase